MTIKAAFFDGISELIAGARATVARGVDLVQVHTNFEIGRRIVQEELRGKDRAAYGEEIVRALAERLTGEFGKGFSHTNLKLMRLFYLQNQGRIGQTVTGQFSSPAIRQTSTGEFDAPAIGQSLTDQFDILQRFVKSAGENSTIGIVLCKRKNKALVEITLPKDAHIHAREYRLYLPSKAELQQKLMEWIGERGGGDE